MKKTFLAFVPALCLFAAGLHAEGTAAATKAKFYGKIVSINHAQKNFTVHNTKQNVDAQFQWDAETGVMSNKKPLAAADLKVGQSLYIAYVTENDLKKAKTISVRAPFKKTQQ